MSPLMFRSRRAVPPPEPPLLPDGPFSADRFAFVDGLWPDDWAERYPLDERVFGGVPRVAGP